MPNPQPQDQPTTVLVVDDEDGIRQALHRFLTRLGYRVLQASSGAEALDRQAAEQPQVMLSDIRMPNMSGVELVPKALAADSDIALAALAAAGDWAGVGDAVQKLAKELGTSPDDVQREIRKRRGGS